jgi:D-alanyl-D-alanine carboxypeptidase
VVVYVGATTVTTWLASPLDASPAGNVEVQPVVVAGVVVAGVVVAGVVIGGLVTGGADEVVGGGPVVVVVLESAVVRCAGWVRVCRRCAAALGDDDPQPARSAATATTTVAVISALLRIIRPMFRRTAYPGPRLGPALVLLALVVSTAACGSGGGATVGATSSSRTTTTRSAPTTLVPATTTTTVPPTTTTSAPPAFSDTVSDVTATQLGATWHAGCPVGPTALRAIQMTYWGFDGASHVGTMVVNAGVVDTVVKVFSTLYADRFPIQEMVPESAYGGNDNAAAAADDTSGFNCRDAVAPGPPKWSIHAFGDAIDVNDVQNPYVDGATVIPPAGTAYENRTDVRPGMAVPGGVLVDAFSAAGWYWGGRWTSSPDYQHFSLTGG